MEEGPVTLKIVHFPLKHSKARCKASSRHYIYSELSFFIFLKQFWVLIFCPIVRPYDLSFNYKTLLFDSQNNDCPGYINPMSLPYCRPFPWPFLLSEWRPLLRLKHICHAGPAYLPPRGPHCISRNPGILINSYILSTKNFLLQLLGGNEGTDCSKFLYGLLVFSTGRGGSGSRVGRRHTGEKRREKTGALSSEVVGHDLTNSTAMESIDLPPAHSRTACSLALPAFQTRHCLVWWVFMRPDGKWSLMKDGPFPTCSFHHHHLHLPGLYGPPALPHTEF